MELLDLKDFAEDQEEVTQFYGPDGKPSHKQNRFRTHLITVPNDQNESDHLPKTLLPTAAAVLLTVMLVFQFLNKPNRP